MEAAWLAAVIVAPVFFNVYSSRIFEPDKITLIRTLALVGLAAWMVKLIEEGGLHWERIPRGENWLKSLLRIPLIAPVAGMFVIYLVSTIFSVTPYTSLWGSYQRLQGTYSTFSYMAIFVILAVNLRRRAQVERLISVIVLASMPVGLYGILQRYRADPIPWGGDVSGRIAANMGNSIFVAAYLIMAFPLAAMRTVDAFDALLKDRGRTAPHFVRATGYVFIVALQLIALYFSASRGPWLGWFASLVLLGLGLSLIWRKRWLTIAGLAVTLAAAVFLIALNIPNGPLEGLRSSPEFGRLGQLLNAESRTGRVRTLIWQGASELVRPHAPLEYPDGKKDTFNILRPLIGYGPESMYVAYNRFYPTELTQVEKRNASPDRSHNETWDSLVITGVFGMLAYLAMFGSLFYYGLKWLGMIRQTWQRNLFLGLYIFLGLASAAVFIAWRGLPYLGVALPFGMFMGVIIYLLYIAMFGHLESQAALDDKLRAYTLLGLTAAILAHFLEANFGIAIAATRTYFWTYAALLLLVGYVLPLHGEYAAETADAAAAPREAPRPAAPSRPAATGNARAASLPAKKRRPAARNAAGSRPPGIYEAIAIGGIVAILLITLGYEYISSAARSPTAFDLLWSSFTTLGNTDGRVSYGLLALVLTTWLLGVALLASEAVQYQTASDEDQLSTWGKMILIGLGVSFVTALIFGLFHASGLIQLSQSTASNIDDILGQVRRSEGILTLYYGGLFLLVFGLAAVLPAQWPSAWGRWPSVSYALATVLFLVAFGIASYTNLRVIQADIAFKTGDLFARPDSWPVAIRIYDRARDLAPDEDYYYLFLGRAYLEYAKTLQDPAEREQLVGQAAQDLKQAQRINPLNTDHTANLARLYSLWSSYVTDDTARQQRAETSDQYFAKAVMLSPHNARLWDEWAVHLLSVLDQPDAGYQRLQKALELDPYYDWTYGLLGDYYARFKGEAPDLSSEQKQEFMLQAAEYYTQAIQLGVDATAQLRAGYAVAYGGLQTQLGNTDGARQAYELALQFWPEHPEAWRIQANLARIYSDAGDMARALDHARLALETAPEDQKSPLQNMLAQLGLQP
jgi:tetratricopeptide (TPR) repeat protein/O-antigen ligase